MQDGKGGRSSWSDEVNMFQATVTSLQTQMPTLKDEDMEGRQCTICTAGIDERMESSPPAAVNKIKKEVLQKDWDVKIHRSHQTFTARRPTERGDHRQASQWRRCDRNPAEDPGESPADLRGTTGCRFLRLHSQRRQHQSRVYRDMKGAARPKRSPYGLFHPDRLWISFGNKDKEFLDPNKVMGYVKERVLSSETDDWQLTW